MYHFPGEVDWSRFFRFDKQWIENMDWARISPAAKAVLPVICCHCNEFGKSFPGEEVIAGLSGMSAKSVRKGIHDLEGFPGYDWEYYPTRRGTRGKRFSMEFPAKAEKGRSIFFYRSIMDGGQWSELKPSAQALYPVMRYFSRYEYYEDENFEDIDEFADRYKSRTFETCIADAVQMAKFAGINRRSIPEAIRSLQRNDLVEPDKDGAGDWKVYIRPHSFYKRSYLNEKLKNKAANG